MTGGQVMTEMDVWYEGELATRAVHPLNESVVHTDAPKEIGGRGKNFSPTDLFAASLASCMLTMMGLTAKKLNVDIKGTRAKVSKEMATAAPRRITKIQVDFACPHHLPADVVAKLVQAAESCPVHHTIDRDVKIECTYQWGP